MSAKISCRKTLTSMYRYIYISVYHRYWYLDISKRYFYQFEFFFKIENQVMVPENVYNLLQIEVWRINQVFVCGFKMHSELLDPHCHRSSHQPRHLRHQKLRQYPVLVVSDSSSVFSFLFCPHLTVPYFACHLFA